MPEQPLYLDRMMLMPSCTGLLEAVLFARIRFHDTVSRGRLLNRFGKDFETIDSNQADHFGRTVMYALNVIVTVVTVTAVGGPYFLVAIIALGFLYYQAARIYGQTSRDMRRLGKQCLLMSTIQDLTFSHAKTRSHARRYTQCTAKQLLV